MKFFKLYILTFLYLFQKLLKELDTQDNLVTLLHNQIQAVRDTEEYDLLSAELRDLQSNISTLKASAVSHYDFKQVSFLR